MQKIYKKYSFWNKKEVSWINRPRNGVEICKNKKEEDQKKKQQPKKN